MKEIEISKKIGRELLDEDVLPLAAKALGCKPQMVGEWRVVRRSVDARKEPLYRYRVAVVRKGEDFEEYVTEPYLDVASAEPVLIVGAGPAGMFAALKLLTRGYKPVILERGKDVHARKFDIARLSREGLVDTDSNYCFGEGGAGTFSDG